jgi:hypothetical protein
LVILLSGAHVAGTQAVAWTSMTMERAHSMSDFAALQAVIMGGAPCRICRAVDQLQAAQSPAAPQPMVGHVDLAPPLRVVWVLPQPVLVTRLNPAELGTFPAWIGEVPTPPPRGC